MSDQRGFFFSLLLELLVTSLLSILALAAVGFLLGVASIDELLNNLRANCLVVIFCSLLAGVAIMISRRVHGDKKNGP